MIALTEPQIIPKSSAECLFNKANKAVRDVNNESALLFLKSIFALLWYNEIFRSGVLVGCKDLSSAVIFMEVALKWSLGLVTA